MYEFSIIFHSFLRWAILFLGVLIVYNSFRGRQFRKTYTPIDEKYLLIFMILCDVQLLVGLYQWFFGGAGLQAIIANGMKEVMKNSATRFFVAEHSVMMLIAIVLIHIAKISMKKQTTDYLKHKKVSIYVGFALLLILASIPWPFLAYGRPWFRF